VLEVAIKWVEIRYGGEEHLIGQALEAERRLHEGSELRRMGLEFGRLHGAGAQHRPSTHVRRENAALREEVERFQKEETSEDHALATLLAAGAVAQTPFRVEDRFSGEDADAKTVALLFRGRGKAAVVFQIKNLDAEQSWSVQAVRLVVLSSGHERAVAVRSTATSIAPGASGVVAIVVDKSAFVEEGTLTNLFLEIYRHDGLRQAWIELDHRLAGE
jgi:hypothetical protein